MAMTGETQPATVPEAATQAGETRRRNGVERTIGTERMLDALERGSNGGVWFSLIDQVFRPETLDLAWHRVRATCLSTCLK